MSNVSVSVAVCASVRVDVSWWVCERSNVAVGGDVSVTDLERVTRSVPVSVTLLLSIE